MGIKAALLTISETEKTDLPIEKLLLLSTQAATMLGRRQLGVQGVCSRIYMASFVQLQSLPVLYFWPHNIILGHSLK